MTRLTWNWYAEERASVLLSAGMSAEEVAAELDLSVDSVRELVAECRDDSRDCGDGELT